MSLKLFLNATVRRVALPNPPTLAAVEAAVAQLFPAVGPHSLTFVDEDHDVCTVASDVELAEALRLAAGGTLRLTIDTSGVPADHAPIHDVVVAKSKPAESDVPAVAVPQPKPNANDASPAAGMPRREKVDLHAMPRWRLEKMVANKAKKLEACPPGKKREWLTAFVDAAVAELASRPSDDSTTSSSKTGGRKKDEVSAMPRWRLEKMLAKKGRKLAACEDTKKRTKLEAFVAAASAELASRPADDAKPGRCGWTCGRVKCHGGWGGPPLEKLPTLPRWRLEKMLANKSAKLEACSDGESEKRDHLTALVAALSAELASRPEAADEPTAPWQARPGQARKMEALNLVPRWRLEKMVARTTAKLERCPPGEKREWLAAFVDAASAELALRPAEEEDVAAAKGPPEHCAWRGGHRHGGRGHGGRGHGGRVRIQAGISGGWMAHLPQHRLEKMVARKRDKLDGGCSEEKRARLGAFLVAAEAELASRVPE